MRTLIVDFIDTIPPFYLITRPAYKNQRAANMDSISIAHRPTNKRLLTHGYKSPWSIALHPYGRQLQRTERCTQARGFKPCPRAFGDSSFDAVIARFNAYHTTFTEDIAPLFELYHCDIIILCNRAPCQHKNAPQKAQNVYICLLTAAYIWYNAIIFLGKVR